MATLTYTIGLPGCGKTTHARQWVAQDVWHRSRSNRDDTGALMHDGRFHNHPKLKRVLEEAITAGQHATISALLTMGRDVICDDTNLDPRTRAALEQVAAAAGADVVVVDMTDVPLATVLDRNRQRRGTPAFVPEQIIRDMHTRWIAGQAETTALTKNGHQ